MKNISLNHNAIFRKTLAFFTFTLLFSGFYFSFVQQAEAVWCPITVAAYNNSGGPQGGCTLAESNSPTGEQIRCIAPFADIAYIPNADCIFEPSTTLSVNGVFGDISVNPGDNIDLDWNTLFGDPADSCTASGSGGWSGGKSVPGGSETVTASMTPGDYDYTITCTNVGGSSVVPRTVTVNAQCNDGIDNDWDGDIDFPGDRGCSSALDDDESNGGLDDWDDTLIGCGGSTMALDCSIVGGAYTIPFGPCGATEMLQRRTINQCFGEGWYGPFESFQCSPPNHPSCIVVNNPPTAPTIAGPTPTTTGTTYYTFSGSTDPDGDNIHYEVDWGDGGVNEFFPAAATLASGGSQVEGHNYTATGTYTISARAIDSNSSPSGWTTYIVTITASVAPANIIDFKGTPNAINFGNSTTLDWTATGDVTSCSLENVTDSIFISGGYAASDSQLDTPTSAGSKTYQLTCYSSSGDDTATTVVTVDPPVSSCSSGPQNSTLQFLDAGSIRADSSQIRLSVSAPATVDPGETFTVSGWGNCFGDDESGSKAITGQLASPVQAFPSTVVSVCPPGTGGSLGTLSMTAPVTPGTYSRDYYVSYTTPPAVDTIEQSPQPVVSGCFEYTVSAAAATPPSVSFDANGEKTTLTVVEGTDVVLNWNVTGGATQCTAGGDWSGNPAVTGGSQSQGALAQGNYTYTLFCENVDGPSPTETVDVVVNPAAPTVDVQVSVDGGSTWSDADQTIDISQDVYISWTSNNTAPGECVGNANVNTSGATSNAGWDAAEPAAGTWLDYQVTCTNVTDTDSETIRVTTANPPNLTVGFVEDATYPSLTPEVDGGNITGNYTDATVRLIVSETAGVAISDNFTVEVELDLNDDGTPDVTQVFPPVSGIAASGAISLTHTFSTIIPISPQSRIIARVDTPLVSDGVIAEANEGDNTDDLYPLPLGLPPIDMELILDPSDLVRGGGNVDINYDVNATFSMNCELYGPGLTTHTFNPSIDGPTPATPLVAGPISSKSVYTLECTELVTGANQVFTESASVETTGTVEEI